MLVGSIVGAVEGSLRSPAYAAAKAGLEGLARSMAVIGGPDGVRVNVVAPGAIATDFDERLLPADHRTDVPLGRMGTADEVAAVIGFLIGPDASYVTGAVWTVDGGRIASRPPMQNDAAIDRFRKFELRRWQLSAIEAPKPGSDWPALAPATTCGQVEHLDWLLVALRAKVPVPLTSVHAGDRLRNPMSQMWFYG